MAHRKKQTSHDLQEEPIDSSSWRPSLRAVLAGLIVLATSGLLMADWWTCLPQGTTAEYVGRKSCIECHAEQAKAWHGSHHDLAMDLATPESVIGDFNDAELKQFDITSRMFQRDKKYWVNTEGPDGKMGDFEVKYVFGVDPLQQYMVEFDRPADMPDNEIARLQVLRISWDTHKKKWFYLPPPDVDEKLNHDDELHWTGIGQRWNTMCAECHSTNLQKNYDPKTLTYHTTFSEMDVSCEACHGPGSVHVELANQTSVFWDRKLGYGLAGLDEKDTNVQIQSCARCHARQQVVCGQFEPGNDYYDHFSNTLLLPGVYYPDGQVMDEDYVFGSFIQSKMYHKDIRCSDCHDPHTTKVKFQGNQLCTSCHQHSAGKYDGPGHHHHKPGSTGASCVECHMPETTYMEVDPRRDHSLRVPRPDLSVKLGTPNACTRCHIEDDKLEQIKVDPAKVKSFGQYADWLLAAREGDEEVKSELTRIDKKMSETIELWYGKKPETDAHFANVLAQAWEGETESEAGLIKLARDKQLPGIIRASAVMQLGRFASKKTLEASRRALRDVDPQVRAAAVGNYESHFPSFAVNSLEEIAQVKRAAKPMVEDLAPMLADPIRLVRTETAMVLTRIPPVLQSQLLTNSQRKLLKEAMKELEQRLMLNNDRGRAHAALGSLYESRFEQKAAIDTYRTAIRVEPQMLGTRRNLAAVLDSISRREDSQLRNKIQQMTIAAQRNPAGAANVREQLQKEVLRVSTLLAEHETETTRLRLEELGLLERRARLLPDNAESQYEYGLFLDLHRRRDEAEKALAKAHKLEPNTPQFLLGLTYYYQKYHIWDKAIAGAKKLIEMRPEHQDFRNLLDELKREAAANPIGPASPGK